jgi:hypothetical protein
LGTISAPTPGFASVSIGAVKTRIDSDFVDNPSKGFKKPVLEGIPSARGLRQGSTHKAKKEYTISGVN